MEAANKETIMVAKSNLRKFNTDLKNFSKEVDIELSKVVRLVALKLFTRIVLKTPVDTGVARASWTIGINRIENNKVNVMGGKLSKQGATALANDQLNKLVGVKAYDTVIISNNVPYIEKLEYGGYNEGPKTVGGFSIQAPEGMVRVSLEEVEAFLKIYLALKRSI